MEGAELSADVNQHLEEFSDVLFTLESGLLSDHGLIGCNQDRHRLIGNAVFLKYDFVFIETPHHMAGREISVGRSQGRLRRPLPGGSHKVDAIRILRSDCVDDGQLPSA